jgi:hypothetical protein
MDRLRSPSVASASWPAGCSVLSVGCVPNADTHRSAERRRGDHFKRFFRGATAVRDQNWRADRNGVPVKARVTLCASIALLCMIAGFGNQARAEVLITPEEAKLPANNLTRRGMFLGPSIEVISPRSDLGPLKSPIRLVLKFHPHGAAKVDLTTLRVTYLKQPIVDLSERVAHFATTESIDMPVAEIPPGSHRLWFDVEDANGEVGSIELNLQIVQ